MSTPRYRVGDTVPLGGGEKSANRLDATRPDGSLLSVEWGNRIPSISVDQPGLWNWQLFIRENGTTRTLSGEFEAFPGAGTTGRTSRFRSLFRPRR